jgi:spore maturation protein CgeB
VGGLSGFDLVLSYTGGKALDQLQSRLGARRTAPLYGWVDPDAYMPSDTLPRYAGNFSYLGTYSSDRQRLLEELFVQPATSLPDKQFVLGGAMYPDVGRWPSNVRYFDHVSPLDHRFFYSSCPLTLNITRGSMAAMGYCPSGRLFEAAACGTAILSDNWAGLDEFLKPGEEILLAQSTSDAVAALQLTGAEISGIGKRARERTLDCHTAAIRAKRLLQLIETSGTETIRNHFELTAMENN